MPRPGPDPDDPWRRPDSGDGPVSDPMTTLSPTSGTDSDGGGDLTGATNPPHTSAPGTPAPGTPGTPRPDGGPSPSGTPAPRPGQVASGGAGGYAGPPPTTAPPPGWRPPVHLQAAPPRQLPAQDMVSLDAQEQRAQRVTWAVGAVAGAVLVVLTCLLCTRLLF
ncbi:hypothetical protein ACN26Z_05400 [Verrucosispora sp. WMMD703]|uniref:hypothetical protein n=1 Tax=Verrucosispora sp. WMMD703 TaxID=3403463 RepID=UPI003B93D849